MWGMSRTLVSNLVEGRHQRLSRILEIKGVGFRAAVQGKNLKLSSATAMTSLTDPAGRRSTGRRPSEIITVSGIDSQQVGQVAANIRGSRPPEPYKGKGVRYARE